MKAKAGWPDASLALRDSSQSNKAILDLSLWKSRPVIICYCENLDRSSWKSRPFNMKISTLLTWTLLKLEFFSDGFLMFFLCFQISSRHFQMAVFRISHKVKFKWNRFTLQKSSTVKSVAMLRIFFI